MSLVPEMENRDGDTTSEIGKDLGCKRSKVFGVAGVPLVQPLESFAPTLPTIRVRPGVSGGDCADSLDGGAGGCYRKTGGVQRVVGVRGIGSGCGR